MEIAVYPNGKREHINGIDVNFPKKAGHLVQQLPCIERNGHDENASAPNTPLNRFDAKRKVDTNRKPVLRIYKPHESLDDKDTVDGDYGSCRVYGEHSDWMLTEKNQSRSPPTSPTAREYEGNEVYGPTNPLRRLCKVTGPQEQIEPGSQNSKGNIPSVFLTQTTESILDRVPYTPIPGTPRRSPGPNVNAHNQQSRQRASSYSGTEDSMYSHQSRNMFHVERQRVRKQLFEPMRKCRDFQPEKQVKGILTSDSRQITSKCTNSMLACDGLYSPYAGDKSPRPHYINHQLDPRLLDQQHHSYSMPDEADDIENMYFRRPPKRLHDDCECGHTPVKQMRLDPDRYNQLNYIRKLKSDVKYLNNKLNCPEPEIRPENCSCALMEEHFFELAEEAYKSIRRQSSSPEGFEQFKKELLETNKMLQESMLVMRDMQEFCEHRSRKVAS